MAAALGGLCFNAFPQSAPIANYPEKPVTIVVGHPAGGVTDAVARAIASQLSKEWQQQVLVDNKSGSNEIIAAQSVSKARPDGYTFLLCTEAPLLLNQFVYSKLTYNAEKDLAPVSHLLSAPLTLVVPAALPVKTLDEFVALAKSRSESKPMTYGSAGAGSVLHLPMVTLEKHNGLKMVHVPYRGAAPLLLDLVSGQVDAAWVGVSAAVPFVREGKLKALVVGGTSRLKVLPEVPVFTETSIAPERADFMYSLVAPAQTPQPIRDKVAAAVKKVLNDPKFRETNLDPFGYVAIGSTPAEFEQFLVKDRPAQAERIKVSGVKPE